MKVLHISSATTWRGGERQVQYLIEGLDHEGHTNFLMTPKVSILGFRSSKFVSSRIEFRKGIISLVQNITSLVLFCKSNEIDIIHGHDSHAHSLLWLAYRFGGLKTKSLISRRLLNPIKNRSVKKYNYPRIERIICISKAVKESLKPSIGDKDRLVVIHSGINLSANTYNPKQTDEKIDFVVGYVAAFTEEKDHKTFFSVANYLVETYPQITFKFTLVGDGPLIEKYKTESQSINAEVNFVGFVEDVNIHYLKMDILLHTSKSEALGTSILDALKFGLPVVATHVGGIPEMVQSSRNGYLCNIGDYKSMAEAVYRLASNSELYNKFSQNSKAILPQYDISIMVGKTINLYQEILKN